MILTGIEIIRAVKEEKIIIDPFDPQFIEPNSYGFHLGGELLVYKDQIVDAYGERKIKRITIPPEGYILEKGKFYLGCTLEKMGGLNYASELYARLSTSLSGIFIQTSAPLGHTGAVIPWTLEIVVAHSVYIYPGMLIGKICFWENKGEMQCYAGRYRASKTVQWSKLSRELP